MRKAAKNHGFTLVELIAVLAIIAVLAAILVPTLIGAVTNSRITSADSSAQQIKSRTTEFLYKMDSANISCRATLSQLIIVVNGGKWTITGSSQKATGLGSISGDDWSDGSDHWGQSYDISSQTKADETEYISYIGNQLSSLRDAYIEVYISKGTVTGVSCIEGGHEAADEMPAETDFQNGKWGFGGSDKAGVIGNIIVGTCPKLTLDNG